MGSVQVTAAAVDVDDPVPMPDRGILIHSAGEKYCRGVADDADGVRIGACMSFSEETEIRYRTETSVDPETGEGHHGTQALRPQ